MTAPALDSEAVPAPRLHQPRRGLVAAAEVVVAVLLGLAATWCWSRGIQEFSYPLDGRPPLVSTRYHGNWVAFAIALVTAGGILLLDAVRQTVLAVRTRAPKPVQDVAQATDEHV
ncbi:hypothetical protein [Umezawaea tangerina]|uniref:Uncharacterized protein n=1 Tax=Umezawaea tangerina TaxID=84725 RepID=A0A2T0TCP1_9PSEU|nr:hypothetical protein [Umezawaea tangerina]PRY43425.1 hypothetical protein CLV43_103168 [Umezawaea tangerina]